MNAKTSRFKEIAVGFGIVFIGPFANRGGVKSTAEETCDMVKLHYSNRPNVTQGHGKIETVYS